MTAEALAGYLYGLIQQSGRKDTDVLGTCGIHLNYLWRLGQGQIKEPSATKIALLLQETSGDANIALSLLVDEHAVFLDGVSSAKQGIFVSSAGREQTMKVIGEEYRAAFLGMRQTARLQQLSQSLRDLLEENPRGFQVVEAMLFALKALQYSKEKK